MSTPYRFDRQGRSLRTGIVVAGLLLALLLAWALLEASPWLMGFLALFTLPALADLIRNPASGLTLDDAALSWHSGRRHASVPLGEIAEMRLDTRLDFSVRATVVLTDGRKIRLPFEATPPHMAFEQALQDRGIRTRRTHFQLFQ